MLQGSGNTQALAQEMRQAMSPPEVILWLALRGRPAGLKFRRQHPSGPFVADFYCHDARLVIEVDGMSHDMGDRPVRDERRDAWFRVRGIEVLRVAAIDVIHDCDAVVRQIVATAAK